MRTSQRQWEARCTQRMPPNIAQLVLERHRGMVGLPAQESSSPWYTANQWLAQQSKELKRAQLYRAFDDAAIIDYAENYATRCRHLRPPAGSDDLAEFHALRVRLEFAASVEVIPQANRRSTCASIAARLDDPHWWRRQLRKVWTRAAENAMRELGIVRKGREPYASNAAVRYRRAQRARAANFLQSQVAINEADEELDLWELAQRSVSNHALRRGEFMTRVRGFEEIATHRGHVPLFVTATAPSAFHAQLAAGGTNPAWSRAVIRAAQQWLCKVWSRVRARWKRKGRLVYGFRIAEPHHDGTPHWHMLLFMRAKDRDAVRADIAAKWLAEFGDEKGAQVARVKFENIDPGKGSATGYVAKYVSKNIDGAGVIGNATDLETDEVVSDSVVRVDAWASIHAIRQFQQLGGPPVGLWREARRIREPVADPDIERARKCADDGHWAAFCYAVGGELLTRKTSLRLVREETGRCNRYGELRPSCTVGLAYASARVYTRPHTWRLERKRAALSLPRSDSTLGPVAITVRGAADGAGTAAGDSRRQRESNGRGPPPSTAGPGLRPH